MHYITNAKYLSDYRLGLTFGDGVYKEVDLRSCLQGNIFEPLKSVEYFRTVRVNPDIDTICWDNGADLSPDFLYEIGQ